MPCHYYWLSESSIYSPPTSRITVAEEVPAGFLATQLYSPASFSCTPRICSVPRCTSCSAKGTEPTCRSPEKKKKKMTHRHSDLLMNANINLTGITSQQITQWSVFTFGPFDQRRGDTCCLACQSGITSNCYHHNLFHHPDTGFLCREGNQDRASIINMTKTCLLSTKSADMFTMLYMIRIAK